MVWAGLVPDPTQIVEEKGSGVTGPNAWWSSGSVKDQ